MKKCKPQKKQIPYIFAMTDHFTERVTVTMFFSSSVTLSDAVPQWVNTSENMALLLLIFIKVSSFIPGQRDK